MFSGNRRPFRLLVAVLAIAGAAAAMAQGKLTVSGKLRVDGGNLDDCKLVVYKDGEKQRTLTADLKDFKLDLDLEGELHPFFREERVRHQETFLQHQRAGGHGYNPLHAVHLHRFHL
jgi:hypothetical protein